MDKESEYLSPLVSQQDLSSRIHIDVKERERRERRTSPYYVNVNVCKVCIQLVFF